MACDDIRGGGGHNSRWHIIDGHFRPCWLAPRDGLDGRRNRPYQLFLATGTALRLLTSESFALSQLKSQTDIKRQLDAHAVDILPPEFPTVDEFLQVREQAIAEIRATKHDLSSDDYRKASDFFASLEPPVSRLVNLAHFEVLRRNLKRAEWPLFFFLRLVPLSGSACSLCSLVPLKIARRARE